MCACTPLSYLDLPRHGNRGVVSGRVVFPAGLTLSPSGFTLKSFDPTCVSSRLPRAKLKVSGHSKWDHYPDPGGHSIRLMPPAPICVDAALWSQSLNNWWKRSHQKVSRSRCRQFQCRIHCFIGCIPFSIASCISRNTEISETFLLP
jgi:hypothetical protein